MRRASLLFLSALAALFLSGCYIDFTALTKINDDGSGFRITTYSTDSQSDESELKAKYILPPAGEWKAAPADKTPQEPSVYTYEAKRTFKGLKDLTPDYTRKGMKPGDISANSFSLNIKKGILFTVYEYEEAYRDCTDERRFREFCERWYNHNLDEAVKILTGAFPRLIDKTKVRALLNERYRPYLDYLMDAFLERGRSLSEEGNEEFQGKMAEFEKKCSEEDFVPFMADYILSQNKNADRAEILGRLKLAYKKFKEEADAYSEQLVENNYDDALGVYGIAIFMRYPFNVSVVMPGKIIDANTEEVRRNTAKWEFSADDFLFKEYTLRATSRKLNYAAAILAGIIITAVVLILWKVKR